MFRNMCDHSNGWRPEDGVPDLAMMSDITAEGININLRTRYLRDQIYTFSGSILLAVNPYKQLDIYDQEWISRYRQQKLDQSDPHIFALTEAMYMNLVMHDSLENQQHNKQERQEIVSTKGSKPTMMSAIGTKNQACVISGESGAGKTETTKFILSYLCSVTPNKSIWMEHQILEANTILEAFGNAKTVRNDNSSRFGKFIQICFDARHQINGCIIQDYLLEQSRITYQSIGERNYHVFYQLLAAGQTNEELRKKFHLMPANFYDYLNKTQCYVIDGVNDCSMFDSLRTAMSVLNMEQQCCDGLFSVLSAILWLGNMQFKCDDTCQNEECQLTENDREITAIVSLLLGVNQHQLEAIMLKRQINVRGSITEIPFKIHEARDNRNGMAKALYSRLFSWVVTFINASTNPGIDNTCFLGVLDIFGFENFDTNSFEQLCINYANEKLHKFFNQHMFAMEQELYRHEGIEFCDINYTDNTPCLELLERPPNCLLRLLSEECRMPKGTDSTFLEKLHNEFSLINPNPFYLRGNDRRNWSSEFTIRHFAGMVTYVVNGFLKKNKDTQQSQLLEIIETANNHFLKSMVTGGNQDNPMFPLTNTSSLSSINNQDSFESATSLKQQPDGKAEKFRARLQSQQSFCMPTLASSTSIRRESSFNLDPSKLSNGTSGSTKARPTVADSFRSQLSSLVDLLSNVNPWYVRCIKPNLEKSATDYDDKQVLMQLRYLGMSDLIRIRREGYPIHLTKHQFVCRYRCLMLKHQRLHPNSSPIKLSDANLDNYCKRMMQHFDLETNDWRIGKTMVLLRLSIYQPLEDKRNQLFNRKAILIQSHWHQFVCRKRYIRMRTAAIRIQETFRSHRGRLQYLRMKRAALTIQAFCRGMFAREIASALREIKRVEKEKAAKIAADEQDLRTKSKINHLEEKDSEPVDQITEITITDTNLDDNRISTELEPDHIKHLNIDRDDCSPLSNISANLSSCTSWVGQDLTTTEAKQRLMNARDKKEMDDLVRVLARHGITLDTTDQASEKVYADFERLYDVLGNQLSVNCDARSLSPSINDDDRCSFSTTGTTCDGDTVSCSGQSQVSSTITDDNLGTDDNKTSVNFNCNEQNSSQEDTVNHINDAEMHNPNDEKYHSNSIESIASIISSTSMQSQTTTPNHQPNGLSKSELQSELATESESNIEHMLDAPGRTSTFTGTPLVVTGSKLVSYGRPLARIEEEPNSVTSSPSKTPNRSNSSRPQSLFPPVQNEGKETECEISKGCNSIKRRRVERRILQVQREQLSINPTTAGLPTHKQTNIGTDVSDQEKHKDSPDSDFDTIYGEQKNSILEYAEQTFNNHWRDSTNSGGVIRTLTRRRRSVDTKTSDYLTKSEMLSYNSSHAIPTSHIKLHDPHLAQLSCSIFKNLCKYMSGESLKNDNETRIIQSIVRNGLEKSDLRDEIYIQIMRQLTNNPNNDQCLRLWILLGLVSAAFPPSKNFSKHMIAYLRSKPRKDPSITCYAQFCLDNLQATRLSMRKYPPSLLEIQACKNIINLNCKVHLLDGRCESLSIHPCDTIVDTLMKLAQRINLQSIEGWALYESYTPGASKYPHPAYENSGDFERTVKPHSYMADLIASWQDNSMKGGNISLKVAQRRLDDGNFKLTLKKRIFRGPKIRNDPVEISLLYAQAVNNVVKRDCFYVDDQLAVGLAGLQAQITLGNAENIFREGPSKKGKISKHAKTSIKSPTQVYDIENYICARLRNQATRSKKEWCNLIHQTHKQVHNVNEVFCKMRYLSMVIYHCPLYGTATFEVLYKGYQAIDQNLMLGVNAEGLVLIRCSDKALISAYRYNEICQDRGVLVFADENIIQINVKNKSDNTVKCLSFESGQIEEISMLMSSYFSSLNIQLRSQTTNPNNFFMDVNMDKSNFFRKSKLKMTLEDRMRTHQEVQNARRAIIKSGKLRRPFVEDGTSNPSLLRHTLKRLSSTKSTDKSTRFDSIYGTLGKISGAKTGSEIPQASSDYNLYGMTGSQTSTESEIEQPLTEIAGATAPSTVDELTKYYPHRYWAYTKYPIRNSLLIIYDPDLEEAAISNFTGILIYSGLIDQTPAESSIVTTQDNNSIDSGIASQQSLSNINGLKISNSSPSSVSSGELYDVCPKKMDERDLIKLAQSLLDKCLKKGADILKNEFFLQLIKQTTDHPDPNSEINKRHWQLLALACSITYPSDSKILSYLYAHLRRCSLDHITDEGQFAQFTFKGLQGTLDTKGRRSAPSEMEILSTINCRRVYARVYFLDGQFQAVEFDPCATIAEVVDQIKQKIGLKPECIGYALFQPLDEDCEQVLQPEEKVGDAIAAWETWHRQKTTKDWRRNQTQTNLGSTNSTSNSISKASIASISASSKTRTHKFVFKKYLFLDNLADLNDPVERELIYHQTVSCMKEDKFPVLEQEATILCALKAQIEIGDYSKLSNLPREHIRMVYKQVVMSLMPPHTYNNLPIPAIAQQHQAFRELSSIDAKKYFFNLIQSFGRANFPNSPGHVLLHQAHVYEATQTFATAWPSDIWIVVNHLGVHILVLRSRKVLTSCEYRQIVDYNYNNNYLMIISMANPSNKMKYTFYTKQAQHIAQQMKDYIVINSCGGNKRRKSVEFNLK